MIPQLNDLAAAYQSKVYRNAGNRPLLTLLPAAVRTVLDVGCGAGDNARALKATGRRVWGLTLSPPEAELARDGCEQVLVANAETDPLPYQPGQFDALLLSHVLEHTVSPARVLDRLEPYLAAGGVVLVAVPNVAQYRYRLKLLTGDWRLAETGPFDRTHLHFWSYQTADQAVSDSRFRVTEKRAGDPALPLWPLRRLAPVGWLAGIDAWAGRVLPNFAASQTLMLVERADS